MAEVKEELNEQVDAQVEEVDSTETTEDEDGDDYFNPFAEPKEEDVKEDKEIEEKQEAKKEKSPVVKKPDIEVEYKADKQASRDVREFVKENPMFEDYANELADIASQAIQRGHSKPVEFAIRNLKSPTEWIEIGKRSGEKSATDVLRTNVGGRSLSKGEAGSPDYKGMSSEDFNKLVSNVKNN